MGKSKYFAWNPIKKLMRSTGAEIISSESVDLMVAHLQAVAVEATNKALEFMRHANRKKLSAADIEMAINN